ncbi:Beta-galactosidase 5 [Hibiscus syriacus]|uniref:Beta-galactosidase 5 n=1 Tax=Hibiscus syriacus TaxID=106335 RepID=A0A6A2ZUQ0_HIBSY|nr:Beta-galactosidase 5 [Hibiscus syriacus]
MGRSYLLSLYMVLPVALPLIQAKNDSLIRQPKYGHLKELHRAIKMCDRALVSADPIITSLGDFQQAYMYTTESGDCAAFLSNYDTKSAARVLFNDMHYNLPPWSISILPDCRNVVFNTAKVGVQTSQMQMLPTNTEIFSWESYDEDPSSLDNRSAITADGLLEQINITRDASDYLCVDIGSSESFLRGGELPTLSVQSTGHAVHVFINRQLSGSAFGTWQNRRFTYTGKVNLHARTNRIALLSVAVGLPGLKNIGGHFKTWNTVILGPVAVSGFDQGKWDLSRQKWTYQVGLKGEAMDLVAPNSFSSVEWRQGSLAAQKHQPLRWHRARKNEQVMSHWLWTWGVWEKVKSGLMGRALVDIGMRMLTVTAMAVIMRERFEHPSVSLVVENQPKDGPCHAPASYVILEKKCVGKQRCVVTIANSKFEQDPCPNVLKRLSVKAICAPMSSTTAQPNWGG